MQNTLHASAEFSGVGLHSGAACRIVVRPAAPDTGIVFRRCDLQPQDGAGKQALLIDAAPENVVSANHGTTLANAHGATAATVEHLMAAFALCSIDNVLVELHGPEIPILDGSAAPFVSEFRKIGVNAQNKPRREIVIDDALQVTDGDRSLRFDPADEFSLDLSIDFEDCLIGRQSICVHMDEPDIQERLAKSRTFCRRHEVESLRRSGLIRGGSLENSLVVDGARLLNGERLRDPHEFALHKALDLIGDLYLLGAPIRGAITAEKPGHDLNVRAAQALARRVRKPDAAAAPVAATA